MDQLERIVSLERRFTNQHFVENHAQRIQVSAEINFGINSTGLLGCNVRQIILRH